MTRLQRWETPSLIIGAVGILGSLLGAYTATDQFFRSWLLSYLFWLAISLGALPVLMIHHLVGGKWGFATRRLLESALHTLPLMAVLFVPLLFGIHHLYEWSHEDVVRQDIILQHKSTYLNMPFFIGRAAFYFAAWLGLAWFFNRWSAEQDRTGDPSIVQRFQRLSGPGLIIYALTITFASTDWVMSLEPHWFSTIYGMMFMVGQTLTALAFVIAVLSLLGDTPPLSGFLSAETLNDLGNLLFAFIMLWAYLSFSQYLIIWSGNLPEEIPWYLRRSSGGWQWIAVGLALFHFAIPFFLLLIRRNKRRRQVISGIAIAVVVMRLVDLMWLIVPAHEPSVHVHWLDVVTLAGIGGLWLAGFSKHLRSRALLPLGDPEFRMESSL
jgi:hypothetical protein